MIRLIIVSIVIFSLSACNSVTSPSTTVQETFVLEDFFDGNVRAYGLVLDFSGELVRRFTVDIEARWEGNNGVLDEYFVYDDGEKQFRQWRIEKAPDGVYHGEADDIIGRAIGTVSGPTLRWQYEMSLSVKGREWNVFFDDSMILVDGKVINRAKIKKFGITVADVILFFEKTAS
jgi:hypothetical protein